MNITSDQIDKLLNLLAKTPRFIAALSRDLDNTRLNFRPEGEWSANDILAHLRASADVRGKSVMAMLSQEHPTLRHVSPRAWMKKTDYPSQDFHVSLEAFTKQRTELLKSLRSLKNKDWSRGATFTAITRGQEQTVFSYANIIAQHESEHCLQIEALLKQS